MLIGLSNVASNRGSGFVAEQRLKLVEVDVHGEFEVEPESDVAASDIGIIGRSRVPGICCCVAGFGKDLIGATSTTLSGDEFVEEAVEAFDAKAFVVASGERYPSDLQGGTHLLENVSEFAIGVDDDDTSNAGAEENVLEESSAKVSAVVFLYRGDNDG